MQTDPSGQFILLQHEDGTIEQVRLLPTPGHGTTVLLNAAGQASGDGAGAFDAAGAAAAAQSAAVASSAQKAANLADLASASTARTNLGLGTAATHAATDFTGGAVTSNPPYLAPNRVSILGDSIVVNGITLSGGITSYTSKDPLMWAHTLLDGAFLYNKNAGVGGNKAADMLARIQTDVVAYGGDWCVVMAGTNDVGSTTLASYRTSMTGIVAALQAAGIRPVLCEIIPSNTSGANRQAMGAFNAWLNYYCYRNGIPLAKTHAALIDPTTGGYAAAYNSGDGLHPSAAGAKVIGQAIANALAPALTPWAPPLAAHQTTDSRNMLAGGLFLVDTNADGVADSYTNNKSATATMSVVTGDTSILGNWQRLVDTSNLFSSISQAIATGFSVGDTLAIGFRVQTNPGTTSDTGQLTVTFNGAGFIKRWQYTIPCSTHTVYDEVVVPAGTTSITAQLATSGGSAADIRFGQLTILNLTALGVLP